ncbi:MAG: protein kinase [Holophagaceae bacterium]|nr:protein kinase [Holophagaceae bacterium]
MDLDKFTKRYEYDPIKDKIGTGGFGDVFRARDTLEHDWVALKIAKVDQESTRLKREVEMAAALEAHANIAKYIACYSFSTLTGEYDFAVMKLYEEGNLKQLLENQDLPDNIKGYILYQVLSGIEFLHNNGIIHRDLKPRNILIIKDDKGNFIPLITDFGISKKLDSEKSSAYINSLAGVGTISYASPEQLKTGTIKKNADLWSFGVIAYQAFTGQLPFNTGQHDSTSEAGRQELFRQIASGVIPQAINSVREPWKGLIQKCLVTDPVKRVKSATECLKMVKNEQPVLIKTGGTYDGDTKVIVLPPDEPSEEIIENKVGEDSNKDIADGENKKVGEDSNKDITDRENKKTGRRILYIVASIIAVVVIAVIGGLALFFSEYFPKKPVAIEPTTPVVYVAGWEEDSSGKKFAMLWEDDVAKRLPDGSVAYSVFVSGGDVWVAGWQEFSGGKTEARLWKNGSRQSLGNGNNVSRAFSVFVVGNEYYVAGFELDSSEQPCAMLWKNNQGSKLNSGGLQSLANSVFVSGSKVLVAGVGITPQGNMGAYLWVNGRPNLLSGTSEEAEATSVFVSESVDVYVAGWMQTDDGKKLAMLWENYVDQKLGRESIEAEATQVFVLGQDVIVSGQEPSRTNNRFAAVYWIKNNGNSDTFRRSNIGNSITSSASNSVFAVDNDIIYSAGYEVDEGGKQRATLWKNNRPKYLSDRRYNAEAHSIVVK